MKKLLTLIILILSLQSFSQDVNKEIDKRIDSKLVNYKPVNIDSFANSLEKIFIRKIISNGTFVIDTLTAPLNEMASYHLELHIGLTGRGYKFVTVSNTNGTYAIVGNVNLSAFTGLTGGVFEVVKVGNNVVVRATSPTVLLTKLKRY